MMHKEYAVSLALVSVVAATCTLMIAVGSADAAALTFSTSTTTDWADGAPVGPSGNYMMISKSCPANMSSNDITQYQTVGNISLPVGSYTMSFDVYWADPIPGTPSTPDQGREELYMSAGAAGSNSSWQNQYGQPTTGWRRRSDTFTVATDATYTTTSWTGRLGFVAQVWANHSLAESYTYYVDNITIVDNSTSNVVWSYNFDSDTVGQAPQGWQMRGGSQPADVFTVVPEPATMMLLASGGVLTLLRRRRS